MKVSLNWLGDHVDFTDRKTDELADLLTFAGIEVEGIEERGAGLEHVVVGRVVASEKHPDADRLSVCRVDDGSGEPRQVVCGARNYAVGDSVPLALPGATLPGGFTIRKSRLRGVESHGMLCSARELGISDEHEGLWILENPPAPGTPIGEIVPRDTLFDLEITPNRPDLLSHLGIARELAALSGRPLAGEPARYATGPSEPAPAEAVRLDAPDACPLYTARRIRGVRVGPSPEWLRRRLESVGLRPINNVVDITNFVLMEMGQPLHAFDADRLEGGIVVRTASNGESFLALDGEEYALEADDLVIADHAKAVAIAGVMGGEDTGVTESTTDVLLESAWFAPSRIRRTSRRLGLTSDSSYRFERGVDRAQVAGASDLAVRLILEIAGGEADGPLLVAGAAAGPDDRHAVGFDLARCRALLGCDLSAEEAGRILASLGLEPEVPGNEGAWRIPTWRLDLERPVDLLEEIARVHGLDAVPATRTGFFSEVSDADRRYDHALELKQVLAARGFHEAVTIKLISEAQLADGVLLDPSWRPVRLRNPLSDDHTVLRTSLLPGLLAVAERNVRMGCSQLAFFETGTVFGQLDESTGATTVEREHLGILAGGAAVEASWSRESAADRRLDAFDLTGRLQLLAPNRRITLVPGEDPTGPCILSAGILVEDAPVGRFVQLHPARGRELDLDFAVLYAEIDLTALFAATSTTPVRFRELPRFPAVTRDVALELPLDLPNADVAAFFDRHAESEPLLESVEVFDVFRDPSGDKLAADRKSIAYSLTYRDPGKTLTAEEVDVVHGRVLEALTGVLPARIR